MPLLVERLRRESKEDLASKLKGCKTIELNYRWMLHGCGEVGFIEADMGSIKLKTSYGTAVKDPKEVEYLLSKEAGAAYMYLEDMIGVTPKFKGYFLKGEKQQKYFGEIVG